MKEKFSRLLISNDLDRIEINCFFYTYFFFTQRKTKLPTSTNLQQYQINDFTFISDI